MHTIRDISKKILFFYFIVSLILVLISCEDKKEEASKKNKVALILAIGGLGDNSVNDSAFAGLKMAEKRFDIITRYAEPRETAEFGDYLQNFADAGFNLIIGIGFSMRLPIEKVAKNYPDKIFAIIDVPATGENVVSLVFREHEGAYLAGVLAARITKTKKVGFLGGMDIPLLRKWQMGFEAGVSAIDPSISIDSRYIDVTVKGFSDPIKGKGTTLFMFSSGCDVILQVTGGSASGVYLAAKESRKYIIGSDQDQDDEVPGLVLTSVMRSVENVMVATVEKLVKGQLKGGVLSFGLKEKGILLTDFRNTKEIIGDASIQIIEKTKERIINGIIKVPDYTKN